MNIDWANLWRVVTAQFALGFESDHGPAHWRRVERNALLLATRSGADVTVVRLFAVFHDSQRWDEESDLEHGPRGAKLAGKLRGTHFDIDDEGMELLLFACRTHTSAESSNDPTIGTCYDADRLDLGRVGIIPSAEFMSTDFGREIARAGSIQPFL